MKRYIVLAAAVIGVAFLFSDKAHAEEVYQDAYADDSICINANGVEDDCTTLNTFNTHTVQQELRIQNGFEISAISIYRKTAGSGSTRLVTVTAYLANGNNKVATSSPTTYQWDTGTPNEVKLNFTPYLVSGATPVTSVLIESSEAGGGGNDTTIRYMLTQNLYPPDYINPGFYSAGYAAGLANNYFGSQSQLSNLRDLAMKVYVSAIPTSLQITYPENNSTVNDLPQTITGTCSDDFDLFVYDGLTYASSTNAFGSNIICPGSEEWFWSFNPEQGFWSVFASSTGQSDGIIFYYLAQSTQPSFPFTTSTPTSTSIFAGADTPTINLNWSCEIPYFSYNPCQVFGNIVESALDGLYNSMTGFIRSAAENTRPFSYVPQIMGRVFSNALSPTTTIDLMPPIPIPISVNGFGTTTTSTIVFLPGVERSIWASIPADTKNRIRNESSIIIGAAALVYLAMKARQLV